MQQILFDIIIMQIIFVPDSVEYTTFMAGRVLEPYVNYVDILNGRHFLKHRNRVIFNVYNLCNIM